MKTPGKSKLTGRPYEGQRPGSGQRKKNKEIRMGRMPSKSRDHIRIQGQIDRLDRLEKRIKEQHDSTKRENLLRQYANLLARCNSQVATPVDIGRIVCYSDIGNPDELRKFYNGPETGRRPDFLPYHHLVKLLDKPIDGGDYFIYVLDPLSNGGDLEPNERNRSALEFFLATFSQRLLPKRHLEGTINGTVFKIPVQEYEWVNQGANCVGVVRSELGGIGESESYDLRVKRIGKEPSESYIKTESGIIDWGEGETDTVLVSYLSLI